MQRLIQKSVDGSQKTHEAAVQCSGGARAQCTQRLLLMLLTREVKSSVPVWMALKVIIAPSLKLTR